MDVAVFVGFAASGPLHVPVAVDDPHQFARVFGDEAPLAWDARRGEVVHAYLAPAVRAFFRNGGVRCWVVRVARAPERPASGAPGSQDGRAARSNHFPVPGLVRLETGDAQGLTPAYAAARSEGSWSDSVSVGSALSCQPLDAWFWLEGGHPRVQPIGSPRALQQGDMLRLTFPRSRCELLMVVGAVDAEKVMNPAAGGELWLGEPPPAFSGQAAVSRFEHGVAVDLGVVELPGISRLKGSERGVRGAGLELSLAGAPRIAPGEFLRIRAEGRECWLRAAKVEALDAGRVRVGGEAITLLTSAQPVDASERVERGGKLRLRGELLTMELHSREENGRAVAIRDLGFHPAHRRFWAALPTDERLFGATPHERAAAGWYDQLWLAASEGERFPLAGDDRDPEGVRLPGEDLAIAPRLGHAFFPMLMGPIPEEFLPACEMRGTAIERDGLACDEGGLDPSLFLDEELSTASLAELPARADFIRYRRAPSRSLRGLHAALALEEATLIAVPDAVHRGWTIDRAEVPLPEMPAPAGFHDWTPAAPVLSATEPDGRGSFRLSWTAVKGAVTYRLEEATVPEFHDASAVYAGSEQTQELSRPQGVRYYRVEARDAEGRGPRSRTLPVRVGVSALLDPEPAQGAPSSSLLDVHRALLRMCAARGDMLAVLSLPEHFREGDAATHANALRGLAGGVSRSEGERASRSPSGGQHLEDSPLTYGALYHPWFLGREEHRVTQLRRVPPDGAVCGLIARRTLARGAWMAPANEPLEGALGLTALFGGAARERLREAQANVVERDPRGLLVLSADTLSNDRALVPIGVRRLLAFLRRAALERGVDYVFEPYDDVFRRRVRRGFEELLGGLFRRGAFAGPTADTSFRVLDGDDLNPPRSREDGRFVVELQVAPSRPLEFLTLRLVQSLDRRQAMEVR
jgi:hypothetical protein